ncbi:hypothetical protein ACQPX6_10485 [Actinomycetospora sp. CA-101289]|uniref:hypothetical protein n=1 Tax=Actinomycetospora sp. CA-101289 TaxID=3239893 RepID=UPI003D956836
MAEHDRSDEGERPAPSLPETVAQERAEEEAADSDPSAAGSIAGTERRTRAAGKDHATSLPGTEDRERQAEEGADAEQARSDLPSVPGTEQRQREDEPRRD